MTSDPATRKARRSWGRPFLEEDPFINGDPLNESDSEFGWTLMTTAGMARRLMATQCQVRRDSRLG